MPSVSMRQLLEAGIHFGHQTRRWNPKMKPFIFAERNGIHIIDLAQTVKRLDLALDAARECVARGDSVLFVGTKKQAQEPIAQEATRAGQPYVNKRWLGGMAHQLHHHQEAHRAPRPARGPPGQRRLRAPDQEGRPRSSSRRWSISASIFGGIRKMKRLPAMVFIVDPHRERIAVTEARKLELPIIGTGDTNVDPDELDYIIPANDDAIRAIRLLCQLVADACIEGQRERGARTGAEVEVPEAPVEIEVPEAPSDALVAALAGGAALSFEPDVDEEEVLLPVVKAAPVHPASRQCRRGTSSSLKSAQQLRPQRAKITGDTKQLWRRSRRRPSSSSASSAARVSWSASAHSRRPTATWTEPRRSSRSAALPQPPSARTAPPRTASSPATSIPAARSAS